MVKKLRLGGTQIKSAYWSLVGMASAMIFSMHPVMAATIWDRFSAIMQDIYGQIVAISTIVAVTVGAIALIIRMVSRNQRAVDEATQWLKRIQGEILLGLAGDSCDHFDLAAPLGVLLQGFFCVIHWYLLLLF